MPRHQDDSHGFAIVEVMIACALLATVAASVAQIVAIATRAGLEARHRTAATVLAAQKMEQLRSLKWTADGSDLTSDLSTEPPTDGGPGLTPSPAGVLDSNMPPYVDYLDAAGQWIATGASPPRAAVYIRRWSIERLGSDPDDTLIFQVLVTTSRQPRDSTQRSVRMADETRLVCVKTRTGS